MFPPVRSRYTTALERELGIVMYEDDNAEPQDLAEAGAQDPPLSQASDVEFLAEFARRLAKARGPLHDQSNVAPFGIKGITFGDGENAQGTDGGA